MALGSVGAGIISGVGNAIGGLLGAHDQRKAARDLNRQNNRVNQVNREQIEAANKANVEWRNKAINKAKSEEKKGQVRQAKLIDRALEYNKATIGKAKLQNNKMLARARDASELIRRRARRADAREARLQENHPVNFKQMMADAEAMGFNPQTYLNSGALGLYARQPGRGVDIELSGRGVDIELASQRTNIELSDRPADILLERLPYVGGRGVDIALSNLDNPASNIWQRNGPVASTASYGSGTAMGSALSAGVNTFLSAQQQIDQNDFQRSLVQSQLSAYNRVGSGSNQGSMGVPSYRSTGAVASVGGGAPGAVGAGGTGGGGSMMSTANGSLYQTTVSQQQMERLEQLAGQDVGSIMAPVIYGPDTIKDPRNQPFFKKTVDDWSSAADHTLGFIWDNYAKPTISLRPGSVADRLVKVYNGGTW